MVLVDSAQRVLDERRLLAQAGAGFGVEVNTLAHWVADLWPLHGDGRTPQTPALRIAAATRLLIQHDQLPATPGMVDLLCQAARESLIYRSLPAQYYGNETAFVNLLDQYVQDLERQDRCEYCEMLEALQAQPLADAYAVFLFDVASDAFTAAEQSLLESLDAQAFDLALQASDHSQRDPGLTQLLNALFKRSKNDAAVQPTGALKCALAAGPTAEAKIILDCIEDVQDSLAAPTICVAAKQPRALFDYCAPSLTARGFNVQLSTNKAFKDTDAGRAVLSCLDLVLQTAAELEVLKQQDEACARAAQNGEEAPDFLPPLYINKLESADFSFNPFAGIWYGSAFRIDAMLRGNRKMDGSEVLSTLSGNASDELMGVLPLFEEGDFAAAIDALEAFTEKNFAQQPLYKAEQLRALGLAREALEAAQAEGAPAYLVLASIAEQGISQSFALPAAEPSGGASADAGAEPNEGRAAGASAESNADAPRVLFMTLNQAAQLAPCSVDALVVGSLDVASYPVVARDNAYTSLLAKWGKDVAKQPLLAQHRAFFRACCASRHRVYVERALNDCDADPVQAAVLFEELMDCYRAQLEDFSDVDKDLRIPEALKPYTLQAGEDKLVLNATAAAAMPLQDTAWPAEGNISTGARELLVLPSINNGKLVEGVTLSPSQIESYLECPYKWFVHRRLRVEQFEEGFGAMERGSFVHHVYEAFYRAFQERIAPKVTHENLPQAEALFDKVFVAEKEHDKTRDPGRRYYPVRPWEQTLLANTGQLMRDSLAAEASFLPSFHPEHFEWTYGYEVPIDYAGCHLRGTVDRIDVDDAGNAVVIDYKTGGLGEFSLFESIDQEEFVLPRKMQALMYAKVVRESLGLNVVGALYYNPFKPEVRGAFDKTLSPADLFGLTETQAKCNSVPRFDFETLHELIDACEVLVAQQIEQLVAGDIAPDPLTNRVCDYCPVSVCAKRQGSGGW